MKRDYPVSDSFPDYAYVSQLMQADEIENTALIHRKNYPYCSGTLYWQFNDSWPSISWSSIDYALHPKLLYYRMKNAYAPIVMFTDTSDGKRNLIFHNEGSKLKSFLLRITECTTNTADKPFMTDSKVVNLFPDSVQNYNVLTLTSGKNSNVVYHFSLSELSDTSKIAECFMFNGMPKDLPLVKANVDLKFAGEQMIEVSADHVAYGVYLYDDEHSCLFSDNGFHLIPGEKKLIKVQGDIARVKVKCLNNISHRKL
jgi:beta-mannosidase